MKNGWIKVILFFSAALMLCGASYHTLMVKYDAIAYRYDTVQYSLARVEAKQYVNEIEYGLKYGKQLKYYFNLDELLKEIHMSSSYIRGVYVTDLGGNTLLSSTNTALPDILSHFTPEDSGAYSRYDHEGSTYIALAISDGSAQTGSLVMKFESGVAQRLIEGDREKSLLQSLMCLGYGLAVTAILLARIGVRKNGNLRFALLVGLMCGTVLFTQAADLGVEGLRTGQKIEMESTRSVQRMAQVLQQQIDTVVDKGIPYGDIGSMDAYFAESVASIDVVDRFYLDTENRVVAVPSQSFIFETQMSVQKAYWTIFLYQSLAALGIWVCAVGIYHCVQRYKRKRGARNMTAQSVNG